MLTSLGSFRRFPRSSFERLAGGGQSSRRANQHGLIQFSFGTCRPGRIHPVGRALRTGRNFRGSSPCRYSPSKRRSWWIQWDTGSHWRRICPSHTSRRTRRNVSDRSRNRNSLRRTRRAQGGRRRCRCCTSDRDRNSCRRRIQPFQRCCSLTQSRSSPPNRCRWSPKWTRLGGSRRRCWARQNRRRSAPRR